MSEKTTARWEAIFDGDPRGQPAPFYCGLVALVSMSPSIAIVTADGSAIDASEWPEVARLIASAPELAERLEKSEAALSTARIDGAREFAEFCVERRGLWYRTHLMSLLARWLAEKEGK